VDVLHHYGYFSSTHTSRMSLANLSSRPCWYTELALPIAHELRDQLVVRCRVDLLDVTVGEAP
jgi:hypothetical protein